MSAAVVLLVALDLTQVTAMDSGLGRLSIPGGSVYPFAHNIVLAARDAGYRGAVTTVLVRQEAAVKALVGIPDEYALACTIPLGRPARQITKLDEAQSRNSLPQRRSPGRRSSARDRSWPREPMLSG